MELIIINYSMSSDSLVFSHQQEIAIALSRYFESVTVFTHELSQNPLPDNVKVFKIEWNHHNPVKNSINILKALFPYLVRNRSAQVFTHMTDAHAALIAPLTFLLRMRHVLWYAHATNSHFLIWASFFVSNIVSSTSGSCNLRVNKKKVRYINQGIRLSDFPFTSRSLNKINRFFYYGRLDPSKNIDLLLELMSILETNMNSLSLDIYGKPVGKKSTNYLEKLSQNPLVAFPNSSIRFNGALSRKEIPHISKKFDCFLNLFTGSLDKTLIEVTFLGLPVVTWNKEYCHQFGTWSGLPVIETLDFIVEEISTINRMNRVDISTELRRRFQLASGYHSFDDWISRLVSAIQGYQIS